MYEFSNLTIMIDLGFSYTYLKKALAQINLTFSDIDVILITHEHQDHIKGLKQVVKNHAEEIAFYLTPKTATQLGIKEYVDISEVDNICGLNFELVHLSHDATDPCGYVFKGEQKITHITDSGYLNTKILGQIEQSDIYLLEANYDDQLIITNPRYPLHLKQRIMSDQGHLSNTYALNYLKNVMGENTTHVLFAHLSENNNDPKLLSKQAKELPIDNKIILEKNRVVEVDIC